ncbi:Hypp1383 [Branchiostoma lanceolatum]|uniref:Hypp1383 protein n=1 Tax=Branchiostoma lanceolatum TaxID=7740 RepID=A0A8K0EIK5_BRALA|nr:Hypp1383 [Branchiostoma lanceolatum]
MRGGGTTADWAEESVRPCGGGTPADWCQKRERHQTPRQCEAVMTSEQGAINGGQQIKSGNKVWTQDGN